jgi:hypothetical protein
MEFVALLLLSVLVWIRSIWLGIETSVAGDYEHVTPGIYGFHKSWNLLHGVS